MVKSGGTGMVGGKINPIFNSEGKFIPPFERNREWSLSFDINTEKLFPSKKGLNRAFRLVSFIRIPLPGVTFSPGKSPDWTLFKR